jgi:sugar O-acyltransferase (sialic acid O-acetyltransferase NeuD family)
MIRAVERSSPNFNFSGFLDNDTQKQDHNFFGHPILGGLEMVSKLKGHDVGFVNLVTGSALARYETTKLILDEGGLLTNFIHPSVDLTMVTLGVGLYIQEGVIVQASTDIADNCSIHMGSLIGHETIIGTSTFIAHAVSVSGCCEIGKCCFIGTNSTILPRIKIGKWVTIGAGCVVNKDIPDYAVVVGNPAKVIKYNNKLGA